MVISSSSCGDDKAKREAEAARERLRQSKAELDKAVKEKEDIDRLADAIYKLKDK